MNWKLKKDIIFFKDNISEYLYFILGIILMAGGTSWLLLPNQLSTGGFAGIGTITYYLFNLPVGRVMFILNIPLFIITIYKLGLRSLIRTIIGSALYSVFIDWFDKLNPITNDRFLACIYGGIIIGLGTALVLKGKGTTGGTELVSAILKEFNFKMKLGNMIVLIDIIIVLLNMILLKEIEIGLYSAIAIYIMGKIIDIVFEGTDFTKLLFIISNKNEQIAEKIGYLLKRGTTGLYGKGMFTDKDKMVLMCATNRRDVIRVKEIIHSIDSKSFIIITNAREVLGKGFKKE